MYGREKLKGKNGEGGGKKGFDMDEELASVKEGSVTRGDKKRNDEEEKREREREGKGNKERKEIKKEKRREKDMYI